LGEAKEHYEKALAMKPAYAEARNNFGNVLHLLGRSVGRWRAYEQVLEPLLEELDRPYAG
jgi:Tfp pilus assembly protein PilF